MATTEEKKIKISEKIDNIQSNINHLRSDMIKINQEVVLIKTLLAEYLLINNREEVKQEKVKGYMWGSY
jgi:SMC interacting uncharacterized protein involved in chromosome segregation|tara:strand:+ start:1096 stop:1302 length:207 start_codon:yes stop_codon:yes gene_type:complete